MTDKYAYKFVLFFVLSNEPEIKGKICMPDGEGGSHVTYYLRLLYDIDQIFKQEISND